MKVAIVDDYFDTLRTLPCFGKLSALDVTVFDDHVEDVEPLSERLRD
jgi:D-3-phosphoglycerate dehydrogenase